ncbi:hypothetical protein RchiOBHm_Chr6g0265081 [Rosa chinensis]|uniref:Uncharacterized protein n=1 Tax=Rosa chinensis TaxID=74649 RepID=A0A2P6PPB3_ROSCH|nr:hypothetical protein RchiOBHm_Chr6g0265081 [Rosa chinensis]
MGAISITTLASHASQIPVSLESHPPPISISPNLPLTLSAPHLRCHNPSRIQRKEMVSLSEEHDL